MTTLLKLIISLLVSLIFSSCALNRVHDLEVTEISKFVFSAKSGERIQIETVSISEGSNPVLHLLESSSGKQVAYDDDSGQGLAAKLSYTFPKSQKYTLIVRSKNKATTGQLQHIKKPLSMAIICPLRRCPFAARWYE